MSRNLASPTSLAPGGRTSSPENWEGSPPRVTACQFRPGSWGEGTLEPPSPALLLPTTTHTPGWVSAFLGVLQSWPLSARDRAEPRLPTPKPPGPLGGRFFFFFWVYWQRWGSWNRARRWWWRSGKVAQMAHRWGAPPARGLTWKEPCPVGSLAAPRPFPLLCLLMGQWILSTTSVVTCQRGLPTASDIRGPGRPCESPLTGGEMRLRAAGARSGKVRGTGVGQWGGSNARPLLSSTL